jgi:PAS domain S-box-containing protein
VLLVGLFYLLDLWTSAYFAIPISYAAALVLAVAVHGRREKIAVAASCTAMFMAEVYLIHAASGPPASAELTNQGFALLMVWSVTTLGLRHHSVQAGRRDSERVANERLALLNTIYTSAPVGLCFVDLNLRYLSMNAALAEMHDRAPEYFIGKTIRDANPDLADNFEVYYRRVIESGKPILDVEIKGTMAARPGERPSWLASYFPVYNPSGDLLGVNVAVRDITGRKQAEADTLFLLDLADCIRFAANADELTWVVAVALGEYVKVNRCAFLEIDTDQDRFIIQRDYHPHIPSLVGTYSLGAFGPLLTEAGRAGQTTTIADVAQDVRTRVQIQFYQQAGSQVVDALGRAARGKAPLQGLPARVLPVAVWHTASTGIDLWLAAVAQGASQVWVLLTDEEAPAYRQALMAQMAVAQALLSGLGYSGQHLRVLEGGNLAALDAALRTPAAQTVARAASFSAQADKRSTLDLAIDHLLAQAPAAVDEVPLPAAGSPFGTLVVDPDKCTLCLSCVSACPEAALADNPDLPQLKFIEKNCVQCGLCVSTCPEDAITLEPRLLLGEQRKQLRVLNEAQPYHCIRCAKPFGTLKGIEVMLSKLSGHAMFQGEALERLKMCGDCRVVDLYTNPGETRITDL